MALNSMNILKCTQPVGDWIYSMLSLYKPFLKKQQWFIFKSHDEWAALWKDESAMKGLARESQPDRCVDPESFDTSIAPRQNRPQLSFHDIVQ